MSIELYDPTATADNDELDLLSCCLSGWNPHDVDLAPTEFRQPAHEQAWRAMLAVADAGEKPNPSSVRLALGAAGDKVAVWLADLFGRPVVPANAPALAERVRRAAQLRDLQDLATRIMQHAGEDEADPSAIAERIRASVDKPYGTVRGSETYEDAFPRVIDQVQHGLAAGLSTPWPDLDRKIHGLGKDRLYIVAARPGVGKSLLGQNLAWHWSRRHDVPVYFASLEMSTDELTTRTLAQVSKVTLNAMLSGKVDEPGWNRIHASATAMMSAKVHICDHPSQTLDSIRAGARDLQRRKGLGLVVVDYLQLVTPRDRRAPREQQVAEISRGLKLLAKELHVPVVAMSQVKRLNEGDRNRPPSLSDLRESGSIEQDADAVLILHIPDQEQPDWADLLVAKARAGQTGPVSLLMKTDFATIEAPARHGAA